MRRFGDDRTDKTPRRQQGRDRDLVDGRRHLRILPRILLGLVLFTAVAHAEVRPLPEWATRVLARGRAAVVVTPVTPTAGIPSTVAGVRGAAASATELYWKDADAAPHELVARAEASEQAGDDTRALSQFRQALAAGASGRVADRAVLGLAVLQLRGGDRVAAEARLVSLVARAPDSDLKYAAGLPLAVSLAAGARRAEAEALLKELMAEAPEHPLARQADSLLWMLSEGR